MPIRRLQLNYKAIGITHSTNTQEEEQKKIRYCSRCKEMFAVQARLGNRILGVGVPKPIDYVFYFECRNCGTIYQKHETKVEPELEPIIPASTGKKGTATGVEKKEKKVKGRGYNPRLKGNKWEIKDEDLQRELKAGAQLISYYSTDPF